MRTATARKGRRRTAAALAVACRAASAMTATTTTTAEEERDLRSHWSFVPPAADTLEGRVASLAAGYSCVDRGGNVCADDADCIRRDDNGGRRAGADPDCGSAWCHADTGTCLYNMWNGGTGCEGTFRRCRVWDDAARTYVPDDGICDGGGPSGEVDGAEGKCIGHRKNECVYAWCPPEPDDGGDGDDDGDDGDEFFRDVDCAVDLHGSNRPMLSEPEMEKFGAAMERCTLEAHPGADVERVEVMGQEFVPEPGRRLGGGGGDEEGEEERAGRMTRLGHRRTRVRARRRCRLCGRPGLPGHDRSLGAAPPRRRLDRFDDCMLAELSDGADDVEELGAFWDLAFVSTSCAEPGVVHAHDPSAEEGPGGNAVEHAHDVADSLSGRGAPAAGGDDTEDEEVACETSLRGEGGVVPMLSQRELLFFDRCFVDAFNGLHNGELMLSSVVLGQDPDDGPGLIRRGRRTLLSSSWEGAAAVAGGRNNRARNRVRRCRRCRGTGPGEDGGGRRTSSAGAGAAPVPVSVPGPGAAGPPVDAPPSTSSRLLSADWAAFNERLDACLSGGVDAEAEVSGSPFPAFAHPLTSETTCELTAEEEAFRKSRAEAEKALAESQAKEKAQFEEHCRAKEERFLAELEAEKERFARDQEEQRVWFMEEWDAVNGNG